MAKYTIEKVREIIESSGDYRLLSEEYVNNKTPLDILCNVCGNKFHPALNDFNKGTRCKTCQKTSRRLSYEDVKNFVEKDGKITLLSKEYKNSNQRLEMLCNVCNQKFLKDINHMKTRKEGCPHCSHKVHTQNKYLNEKEVFDMINELHHNTLEFLSPYEGIHKKVRVKSKECGHEWEAEPSNLKKIQGCPYCKMSSFEQNTKIILDNIVEKLPHWKYEIQKKYKDCKYINCLPFDFYLYSEKRDKGYLIECQGLQHYKPAWGGEEEFKLRQKRDKVKRDYCKKNNIPLLELRYDQITESKSIIYDFLNIRIKKLK